MEHINVLRLLTNIALTSLESFFGYGVLTANATQLAKIVVSIKISKALKVDVKRSTTNTSVTTTKQRK